MIYLKSALVGVLTAVVAAVIVVAAPRTGDQRPETGN